MRLSKQFLDDRRTDLCAEKERLEKEVKKLSKYPDYGEMTDDNDMELRDYENNKSIEDQFIILLKKVKAALRAIDNGTYGQCRKCKEMIETGRLEAMPYADLCVSCNKNVKK